MVVLDRFCTRELQPSEIAVFIQHNLISRQPDFLGKGGFKCGRQLRALDQKTQLGVPIR